MSLFCLKLDAFIFIETSIDNVRELKRLEMGEKLALCISKEGVQNGSVSFYREPIDG